MKQNQIIDQIIKLLGKLKQESEKTVTVQDAASRVRLTFKVSLDSQRITVIPQGGNTEPDLFDRKISTYKGIAACLLEAVKIAENELKTK